jgi:hypothetical protein
MSDDAPRAVLAQSKLSGQQASVVAATGYRGRLGTPVAW